MPTGGSSESHGNGVLLRFLDFNQMPYFLDHSANLRRIVVLDRLMHPPYSKRLHRKSLAAWCPDNRFSLRNYELGHFLEFRVRSSKFRVGAADVKLLSFKDLLERNASTARHLKWVFQAFKCIHGSSHLVVWIA